MGLLEKFRPQRKLNTTLEILEHVEDLLNTKRFYGTPLQDFGVIQHQVDQSHKSAEGFLSTIQATLKKYEPRLLVEEISVVPTHAPLCFSFMIKCRIRKENHSILISFENHKKLVKMEVDP